MYSNFLQKCVNKDPELPGLSKLLEFFKSQYYDERLKLVKPNDFSDFSAYHVKKVCTIKYIEMFLPNI